MGLKLLEKADRSKIVFSEGERRRISAEVREGIKRRYFRSGKKDFELEKERLERLRPGDRKETVLQAIEELIMDRQVLNAEDATIAFELQLKEVQPHVFISVDYLFSIKNRSITDLQRAVEAWDAFEMRKWNIPTEMKNSAGKVIKLEDFKGKVIRAIKEELRAAIAKVEKGEQTRSLSVAGKAYSVFFKDTVKLRNEERHTEVVLLARKLKEALLKENSLSLANYIALTFDV